MVSVQFVHPCHVLKHPARTVQCTFSQLHQLNLSPANSKYSIISTFVMHNLSKSKFIMTLYKKHTSTSLRSGTSSLQMDPEEGRKNKRTKNKLVKLCITDKRNIILDPSLNTKRTPCLDATLPSTCTNAQDQKQTNPESSSLRFHYIGELTSFTNDKNIYK